jgi:DNA-binding Lrp family transcriptional regulator
MLKIDNIGEVEFMAIAYILIRTSPGHERDVFYSLRNVPGLCEAHPLVGRYNIIVKIKAENFEKLGYLILDKINHLKYINCTETLTATQF